MAVTTRAKFRCTGYTTTRWGAQADPTHAYEFQAMYDPDQPEDERFAKATPTGSLKFVVDNPSVSFEPGASYYIDITPVDDPPAVQPPAAERGQRAYAAYGDATGGLTHDGQPMPTWTDLGDTIQQAWIAAAHA
jgi:hypothetical protein